MSFRMEAGFERLKDAVAAILPKEVEFPRGAFVTVLDAKMTANTAHARITLSVMPTSSEADVLKALRQYDHEIKDALGQRLRLRRIPSLHFVFDETEAEAAVIEEEINRWKKEEKTRDREK